MPTKATKIATRTSLTDLAHPRTQSYTPTSAAWCASVDATSSTPAARSRSGDPRAGAVPLLVDLDRGARRDRGVGQRVELLVGDGVLGEADLRQDRERVRQLRPADGVHRADRGGDQHLDHVGRVQARLDPLPGGPRAPRAVRAGDLVVGEQHPVGPVRRAERGEHLGRGVDGAGRVEDLRLDAGEHRQTVDRRQRADRREELRDVRRGHADVVDHADLAQPAACAAARFSAGVLTASSENVEWTWWSPCEGRTCWLMAPAGRRRSGGRRPPGSARSRSPGSRRGPARAGRARRRA